MSVVLTGKRAREDAGYFRIGDVVLTIPPETIQTVKMSNNEELTALRAQFPFYKKTGHERLDVTITWKALVDTSSGTPDYSQWEDLRRVVAFMRVAPFIQVESSHLRQIVLAENPNLQDYERMAFALRQLRVETLPDITDGLQATLNMTLFNYGPYSREFSYEGESGEAHKSTQFQMYVSNWIAQNWKIDWTALPADELLLAWREYLAIPIGPKGQNPPAHEQHPTPQGNTAASPALDAGAMLGYMHQLANELGLDWEIIQYQVKQESGGRQSAVSVKGASGIMQLMPDAVEEVARWARIHAVVGETVQEKGRDRKPVRVYKHVPEALASATFEQAQADPKLNVQIGMYYMAGLLYQFDGDYAMALAAYNGGPSRLRARARQAADGTWLEGMPQETRNYVRNIMGMAGKPISDTALQTIMQTGETEKPEPAIKYEELARNWKIGDYYLDHATERAAFYYKRHTLNCTDHEVYPVQFSIVFVNNLAALPLEANAYPTYQHIGSPGTLVSISMLSKGEQSHAEAEPQYAGLERITGAITVLDEQYHAMRNEWRAASSVHSMQALFVQNRVLNMLGITALLPSQWDTDTVPDSAQVVQAKLTGPQYENTYEQLESYRVRGLVGPYQDAWEKILNSSLLGENMNENKRQLCKELLRFKNARDRHEKGPVAELFREQQDVINSIPFNFEPDEDLKAGMRGLLDIVLEEAENPASAPPTRVPVMIAPRPAVHQGDRYPSAKARIQNGEFLWSDYILLTSEPAVASRGTVQRFVKSTDHKVKAAEGDTSQRSPMETAYSDLFRWNYMNKPSFNKALMTLETQDPKVKEIFRDLHNGGGPGQDEKNAGHGTYRDLGLSLTLAGADNNPGMYFVNDNAKMRASLTEKVEVLGQRAAQVVRDYVQPDPMSSRPKLTSSDPELLQNMSEQSLLRAQLPPLHMGRAFPGYKLFLMEDDNSGVYYAYDDFYSYNAVLGIEIIRYQDQPDTARIQMANSTNILTHRLFDNSVWGKVEQRDNKNVQVTPNNSNDEASVRGEGGPVYTIADETVGHVNLTKGFKGAESKSVPNQYFALQPGTKLQIRFGYTNDPDLLFPVFTGMVTEVEEGEILTVTAQSYLVELITNVNVNAEDAPSGSVGGGPFWHWWRKPGDSESVIAQLLGTSRANHFGKWQVRPNTGTLAKGFQMDELKGLWSDAGAALKSGGEVGRKAAFFLSTLANGYNRSPENIRINRFFTPTGSLKSEVTRPWNYENPDYLGGRPVYTFPKDMVDVSPWQIMRDIARRYPENILCVKDYGFPFQADATLVFGHPNDWYISRFALHNEAELGRFSPTDAASFAKWWNPTGKAETNKVLDETCKLLYSSYDENPKDEFMARIERDREVGLQAVVDRIAIRIAALGGTYLTEMSTGAKVAAVLNHFVSNWAILGNEYRKTNLRHASQLLVQLWGDYERIQKLGRSDTPGETRLPGDRFQPLRRWHMITSEFIIHNGIVLNENISNAVKIQDKVYPASGHIPKELLRVLDATNLILATDDNCSKLYLQQLYAQSFLKEEVGKMYRGELMLTGIPEIQPYDVILLADAHRGIYGPIEVESVIQEFSQEYGFITIVRPRALLLVNEVMGAGLGAALADFMTGENGIPFWDSGLSREADALVRRMGRTEGTTKATGAVLGTTAAAVSMGQRAAVRAGGRLIARKGAIAAGNVVASAAGGLAGGATTGIVGSVGGVMASSWLAIALLGAGATYKSFIWAVQRQEANPLFLLPLTQFDRPWVAGVQGWQMSDLSGIFMDNFQRMVDVEVRSTIEGFKRVYAMSEAN